MLCVRARCVEDPIVLFEDSGCAIFKQWDYGRRRAGGYVPLCDLEEDAYGAPPEITVAGVARGARYRALGRNAHTQHRSLASRKSE